MELIIGALSVNLWRDMFHCVAVSLLIGTTNYFHISDGMVLSVISTSFNVNCVVRQGEILSPISFSIYVNDLICGLCTSGFGRKKMPQDICRSCFFQPQYIG